MKAKYKSRRVYRVSLKSVVFLAFFCIIIPFYYLNKENPGIVGLLLIGGLPLISFIDMYSRTFTTDAEGIEYRTLWKSKFISWDDISRIKIDLRYNIEGQQRISTLIYEKKNSENKPYLSIENGLLEIPILEIKENEKPNSRLRRLLLVKRRKLMVDSERFKQTEFYKDVQNFAQHIQIEESIAYT